MANNTHSYWRELQANGACLPSAQEKKSKHQLFASIIPSISIPTII